MEKICWTTMHEGPLRIWIVGLAPGSVSIQMSGQSLSHALDLGYRLLSGADFGGSMGDYMIQYFGRSNDAEESILVITKRTNHLSWQEVCDLIDTGAFLEVHEDGLVRIGKITSYEWQDGILCLNTLHRVQRREDDNNGKWLPLDSGEPFKINPCCIMPVRDSIDWIDFQLTRPGTWAVIKPGLYSNGH